MPVVSLKAHFDGQSIQLDEPFELPPNAQLLVTVLATTKDVEAERAAWSELSLGGLAHAYGSDEPEYSASDIVP